MNYLTTENFKAGDFVWFCNIQFHPSGRNKFQIKPTQVKIQEVRADSITLDFSGHYWYNVPNTYNLHPSTPLHASDYYYQTDLNIHISKTKEESEMKFNKLIRDIIDDKYQAFKRFESNLMTRIL